MSDYLDVDAFLADNQKLPCIFLLDVPHMGHLEGTGQRDIRKGATIDLPFWLGLQLANIMPDHDLLTLALPKSYSSRVRNALAASATSVQLKSLGGGPFFRSGVSLEDRINDPKLKATLHSSFVARLPEVFDQSQHHTSTGTSEDPVAAAFVAGLDDWERELMSCGETSARSMRQWATPSRKGAGTR